MKTLHKYTRNLTRAAFERYGFGYGELLARWPEIVGADLAEVSAPERIKWPRRHDGRPDRGQPGGGTLVVRVAEGRGLELHYLSPRIIERINGFYGYTAIAGLKLLQGKLPKANARLLRRKPDPASLAKVEQRLHAIGDEQLRRSLKRLGEGVLSQSQSGVKVE